MWPIVEELDHFCEAVKNADALEPPQGIRVDVQYAVDQDDRFSLVRHKCVGDVVHATLEWAGTECNVAAIMRDFFHLYARFCEGSQFVQFDVQEREVIVNVISGNTERNVHLHLLRFTITGEPAREAAESYWNWPG
jgi:hypothetical protein